jgi:Na+-translocating ferredoxin:NAD+ oxidoreductase RnfC subunit
VTARKETTGKAQKKRSAKARKNKSALDRLQDELPPNLRDYAKQVRRQLNALERQLERAVPQARRRTARLIREASHNLGAAEARGEKAWRDRAAHMTKDAQKLLHKLEMAVAPPRAASKKKATRKKTTAKKSSQKAAAGD